MSTALVRASIRRTLSTRPTLSTAPTRCLQGSSQGRTLPSAKAAQGRSRAQGAPDNHTANTTITTTIPLHTVKGYVNPNTGLTC